MTPWATSALIALALAYIRVRWRRSPQAYRAMIALAACYLVAGSIMGRVDAPSYRAKADRSANSDCAAECGDQ